MLNNLQTGPQQDSHQTIASYLEESIEYQTFNDKKFTSSKKSEAKLSRRELYSAHRISIHHVATPSRTKASTITPIQVPQPHNNSPSSKRVGAKSKQRAEQPGISRTFLRIQSQANESASPLRTGMKLQRYSRISPHCSPPPAVGSQSEENQFVAESQQVRSSKQKVSLLKKLLEHYHIRTIEKSYYSNLVQNFTKKSYKPPQTPKADQRSVTVHKAFPRRQRKKQAQTSQSFIEVTTEAKDFMSMQEKQIQEYLKNPITLQAQSINHAIRQHNQKRKVRVNTTNEMERSMIEQREKRKRATMTKIQRRQLQKNNTSLERQILPVPPQPNAQNCIGVKVNKYREFLFILNLSHGIYRQLDIQKYDKPFKVFVGIGNNSNLIKAILKKRFWFQLTKNKNEAHFVWTQLKEELHKQSQKQFQGGRSAKLATGVQKKVKSQSLIKPVPVPGDFSCQEKITGTNPTLTSDSANEPPIHLSLLQKNKHRRFRNKMQAKYYRSLSRNSDLTPLHKLLTPKQITSYHQILAEVNYRRKGSFNDRLKGMKGIAAMKADGFEGQVVHNHLPMNGLLGNKKAMFYILRYYYRAMRRDVFEVVPQTYHIRNGFLDQEYKAFLNNFVERSSRRSKNYWVIKPGEYSNRGNGIQCTNRLEAIRGRINELRKLGKERSLIIQKYITKPLLYNGRKFDIRAFMLVTTNHGKVRGYWYQEGYIRTASYHWDLEQIEDTQIHLTNDAIQKRADNYGRYEAGNKITYGQLQRYLDTLPKPVNFQDKIHPKLKEIACDSLKASFHFLDPERQGSSFELFGFDFMLDSDFKPWLIEINTNPCLEMSCPVLERIFPHLLENAIRIGLDPYFPPPLNFNCTHKYSIPENALHYNRFSLIFDQERDGAALIPLHEQSRILQQVQGCEEDKEMYEEDGDEAPYFEAQ